MIQDTSRIALKHFESDGRLNRREKTIVQFLLERDKPMTRQEISVGTKLPINIVSGRVYDLIHKKEVLIEFKKHRQCAITGELANTVTTNANRMLINDRKPEIKTGEYGQIAFC